ncbi:hypothetical protein LJC45_03580 [Alistipes sp. OttesenSCG-928-B03]|nr:hypothetical protein [Alistipes sp. OttesenSCG-928-B03]
MEYFVVEVSKDDKEMIDFLESNDDIEIVEEDNFAGEAMLFSAIIPITANILPVFVRRFLDRKVGENDSKRIIVTPEGRYEFSGYSDEEVIAFLMKIKNAE